MYIDELVEKLRNIGMSDMEIIEAVTNCVGKGEIMSRIEIKDLSKAYVFKASAIGC